MGCRSELTSSGQGFHLVAMFDKASYQSVLVEIMRWQKVSHGMKKKYSEVLAMAR